MFRGGRGSERQALDECIEAPVHLQEAADRLRPQQALRPFAVQQGALGGVGLRSTSAVGLTDVGDIGRTHAAFSLTEQRQSQYDVGPIGIVDAFVKVCQYWKLQRDKWPILLGFGQEPWRADLILNGSIRQLWPDIADRMAYVVGISLGLGELFDDDREAEVSWLTTPRPELENRSPMDFMLEGRMKNLIALSDLVLNFRGL
jgi:hypothetical protein